MLRITWSGMHAYMCACIYIDRQIYIYIYKRLCAEVMVPPLEKI